MKFSNCGLLMSHFALTHFLFSQNDNSNYLVAVVNGQQWVMVFRGASGDIGGANNIFTLWNSFGTSGENVPCANIVGSRCNTHYKNKLVENWNKMIIHKVSKRAMLFKAHDSYII